jgi:hypothetical protein
LTGRGLKIGDASGACTPYFRLIFANCVVLDNKEFEMAKIVFRGKEYNSIFDMPDDVQGVPKIEALSEYRYGKRDFLSQP